MSNQTHKTINIYGKLLFKTTATVLKFRLSSNEEMYTHKNNTVD